MNCHWRTLISVAMDRSNYRAPGLKDILRTLCGQKLNWWNGLKRQPQQWESLAKTCCLNEHFKTWCVTKHTTPRWSCYKVAQQEEALATETTKMSSCLVKDVKFLHVWMWLYTGFGLAIGFIEHLQIVNTNDYSANANSHKLQLTKARTKTLQSAVSSPVVAWWRLPTP
jgi:hypothetical protein